MLVTSLRRLVRISIATPAEGRTKLPDRPTSILSFPREQATHPILRRLAIDPNLSHRQHNRMRAIQQVPVYSEPVGDELIPGEAVLVDDFHLFYDCGFA